MANEQSPTQILTTQETRDALLGNLQQHPPAQPHVDTSPPNSDGEIDRPPDQDHMADLVPLNRAAIENIQLVADRMNADPKWAPHASKFLVRDSNPPRFRIALTIPPLKGCRWTFGSSPDECDLLLVPELHREQVGTRHGELLLNPGSTFIFVRAGPQHQVIVAGNRVVEESQRKTLETSLPMSALASDHGVQIEGLSYVLKYNHDIPEATATMLRQDFWKRQGWLSFDLPPPLSVTPAASVKVVQDFLVGQPAFSGTFGSVAFGHHRSTGAAIACKTINRKAMSATAISNEIRCLSRFRHDNIVHLAEGFKPPQAHGVYAEPEVHLVLEPAMYGTLDVARGKALTRQQILTLAHGILAGLAYLHSQGAIHRDIKPANIGISSHQDRALLLDLGACTVQPTGDDHMKGTLSYLAPEIWALKNRVPHATPYTAKVDVWAAGLAIVECLIFAEPLEKWWRTSKGVGIDEDGYVNTCQSLRVSTEPLAPLVLQMLRWRDTMRISAEDGRRQILEVQESQQQLKRPLEEDLDEAWAKKQRREAST